MALDFGLWIWTLDVSLWKVCNVDVLVGCCTHMFQIYVMCCSVSVADDDLFYCVDWLLCPKTQIGNLFIYATQKNEATITIISGPVLFCLLFCLL